MTFEPSKEGNRLVDLITELEGVSRDDFEDRFVSPCLLQVPVEGAFEELAGGDKQTAAFAKGNAASTMHMSLKDLEGLKRSRNVDQALVHFMPDQEVVVVGRSPDGDLVLSATGVSRRHAEFRRSLGNWLLVDLESHNGTFINGNKLEPGHPTAVLDKQNLWFGSYRALFLYPEQIFNLVTNLRKKARSQQ
ncbi:MAG: FHA domain-containing protein [Planctomycetota bacterium]|nr:MAG: FHA domain-containing protein [Planctomycetota bacterium]